VNAAPPTERQIQREILAMRKIAFPRVFLFAIPNGAQLAGNATARFKQIGALKGDGLVTGCPDLCALWNGGAAMLEVKRPKSGRLSDDQRNIHELLTGLGIPVRTVTSIDQAYSFLRECGAPWSGIDPRINPVADAYHPGVA
jgi:hypothetical protein